VQPDETNSNQQPQRAGTVAEMVEETFGQSVRERREQLGLSQRALAEMLGVHHLKLDPTAITRIEKGQRAVRLGEAVMIASALKVPLNYLLAERTTVNLLAEATRLQSLRDRARDAMKEYERDLEAIRAQINRLRADAEGGNNGEH